MYICKLTNIIRKHLIVVLISITISCYSQVQYNELKPLLTIQFAENISWPGEKEFEEFNIGFIGNDTSTLNELKTLEKNALIKGKKVNIVSLKNLEHLDNIQLLYLDKEPSGDLEKIIPEIENKNILLSFFIFQNIGKV